MASYHFVFCVVACLVLVSCMAAPDQEKHSVVKIPPSCKGQRFCSVKPEGYELLEERINRLLPKFLLKEFADRAGEDFPTEQSALSPEEDWDNCPTITTNSSMFLHIDEKNSSKVDTFVQVASFRQYITEVKCAKEHIDVDSKEQCFKKLNVKSLHLESSCVQTKATRTLLVFDPEQDKLLNKPFQVPACCTCRVSDKF